MSDIDMLSVAVILLGIGVIANSVSLVIHAFWVHR